MTCIDWLGREIELEKMCRVIKERDENVLMSEERVEKVEGVFEELSEENGREEESWRTVSESGSAGD